MAREAFQAPAAAGTMTAEWFGGLLFYCVLNKETRNRVQRTPPSVAKFHDNFLWSRCIFTETEASRDVFFFSLSSLQRRERTSTSWSAYVGKMERLT